MLYLSRVCPWKRILVTRSAVFIRFATTSAQHDASKLRNMALVAHIDSGKTTLTESILLKSSFLSAAGTVDTGSTTTDFLPAERERGITIQSASIPVKWRDWTFNLIDTPGHADFGMEVESASRVIDGAVVLIDSVEGVEAQTKGVWKQLDRYGVKSRIMFLNKLDRAGASFRSSLLSLLSHRLHPKPAVLALPVASFDKDDYTKAEPGIQGLVDLVKWELWRWDSEGQVSRQVLPTDLQELREAHIFPSDHPILEHLAPARTALLDNLSMFSEELMETLLNLPVTPSAYLTVPPGHILPHLRAATLRSDILPVLCGSAFRHVGTELVMDYVGELLPSPMDVLQNDLVIRTAKPLVNKPQSGPLVMLAWKVGWDKRKGWMTFIRVYSGTVRPQSNIINATRNQREKISKLLLLYANQPEEVDSLPFGSVGVILGLKYTRTGDTLVDVKADNADHQLRDIVPPAAVMSASVMPQTHADLEPVQNALNSLARTDPSVRVEQQEGQILVHGLGALHLEIVENRLRDEWQAAFEFGKRRVSYRESFGTIPVEPVPTVWNTVIGGKPVNVAVEFDVRALREDEQGDPLWDGNAVLDPKAQRIGPPDSFANLKDPMANIAQGISNTLSSSPHTFLQQTRIHIQVKRYRYSLDLPSSVLAGATAFILREICIKAGMGPVLEPYIHVKVTVNEETVGKVIKDLTEHGAELLDLASSSVGPAEGEEDVEAYPEDGVYVPPGIMSPSAASSATRDSTASLRRSVYAVAPLSRMLDYSNRLRAMSGGHGVFEMMNAGFKEASEGRKTEILREIGRA